MTPVRLNYNACIVPGSDAPIPGLINMDSFTKEAGINGVISKEVPEQCRDIQTTPSGRNLPASSDIVV